MKVMVLGGGNCQINLIKRLKSEGDEIILIDYLTDCPASAICDQHLLISTFDTDSVIKAAKEEEIEAVITLGTDQPVYTAAIVANELNIPFYLTPKQALSATNKRVMKTLFKKHGIQTANYRLIKRDFEDRDIEGILYPAVMKPVDSQGQRGIYKVHSIEEIRMYIDDTLSFSREDNVLLEEYYKSDEITINGWLSDGTLTLLSVVDRVTMTVGPRIGICIAHNFPSLHLERKFENIQSITEKIINTFGFKNGPVYFQYLIGEEGIKVNEIAMRIGGAYEDVTLPLISGIDVLGMLIDTTKGRSIGLEKLNGYHLALNKVYLSTQMFFLRAGKITKILYDENKLNILKTENISLNFEINDEIGDIENATARAGYFIVQGKDFKDMIVNIEKAYDELAVLNEMGENMVIRYSDYLDKYKFVMEEDSL